MTLVFLDLCLAPSGVGEGPRMHRLLGDVSETIAVRFHRVRFGERGNNGRALKMRAIKCLKGVRWMPWHAQAMKDVVRCEKPWGAANKL